MTLPGPSGAEWAGALLAWAALTVALGEVVRTVGAVWVRWWRPSGPIERGLVDLYLGGAALYLLSVVSLGAFGPVLEAVAFGAVVALAIRLILDPSVRARAWSELRSLGRYAPLAALVAAAALFAVELWSASSVGTGNTFDSSVLTLFTALLLQHHSVATALAPYGSGGVLYPQGTSVWLGWAQSVLGLPPARVSLLVTPLFLALAPLAGYVLGERMFADDRAAAMVAVALAFLGPGSRAVVGGSNDFVLSVPLVLLLASRWPEWTRAESPAPADAVGFGLLVGYSAAINPTGAEWLLPVFLLGAVAARGRSVRSFGRAVLSWAAAVAASLLALAPTLTVLVEGRSSAFFTPGVSPPPGGTPALSVSGFLDRVDPFLLGPNDQALSSVSILKFELVGLLLVGVVLLLWGGVGSSRRTGLRAFRSFALSAGAVLVGLLALLVAAGSGTPALVALENLTSADELSLWLFLLFGLVATVPLVTLLEPAAPSPPTPTLRGRRNARRRVPAGAVGLLVAAALVVPGVALTPVTLAPQWHSTYVDFGDVSAADFDLLSYAGSHLPSGARVLVAPGSAAEFLPGYATHVVMLYPMVTGWPWADPLYTELVSELTNGTLAPNGVALCAALNVTVVLVTMANSVLWPAFSPAPLLADHASFPLEWHEGDAYLFAFDPGGG